MALTKLPILSPVLNLINSLLITNAYVFLEILGLGEAFHEEGPKVPLGDDRSRRLGAVLGD